LQQPGYNFPYCALIAALQSVAVSEIGKAREAPTEAVHQCFDRSLWYARSGGFIYKRGRVALFRSLCLPFTLPDRTECLRQDGLHGVLSHRLDKANLGCVGLQHVHRLMKIRNFACTVQVRSGFASGTECCDRIELFAGGRWQEPCGHCAFPRESRRRSWLALNSAVVRGQPRQTAQELSQIGIEDQRSGTAFPRGQFASSKCFVDV